MGIYARDWEQRTSSSTSLGTGSPSRLTQLSLPDLFPNMLGRCGPHSPHWKRSGWVQVCWWRSADNMARYADTTSYCPRPC